MYSPIGKDQLTNHKDIDSNFLDTVDSHRLKPDGRSQPSNNRKAEWFYYWVVMADLQKIQNNFLVHKTFMKLSLGGSVFELMAMDKYGHVGLCWWEIHFESLELLPSSLTTKLVSCFRPTHPFTNANPFWEELSISWSSTSSSIWHQSHHPFPVCYSHRRRPALQLFLKPISNFSATVKEFRGKVGTITHLQERRNVVSNCSLDASTPRGSGCLRMLSIEFLCYFSSLNEVYWRLCD